MRFPERGFLFDGASVELGDVPLTSQAPAAHMPVGATSTQASTSPGGAIVQGHALAGAPSSQASTSGPAAAGTQHVAMGAPSFQSSTSTSGAIVQTHQPLGATSTQGSTSTSGAASQPAQPGVPEGATSTQAATSSSGAITQTHTPLGAVSTQGATSPGAALGQTHTPLGAPSSQAATSGPAAATTQHVAFGAPSFQSSSSPGGAIIQFHRPQGAVSTQGSTSPGRAASQTIGGETQTVVSLTVEAPTYVLSGHESMQLAVEIEVAGGATDAVKFSAKFGTIGPEGIYTAPLGLGDEQRDYITITPVAGKDKAVTVEVTIRPGVFDSWGLPVTNEQKLLPVIWPELDEPTEAQAESGNYRKDRMKLRGLRIVIENPRGSLRRWRAADGTRGATQMQFAYGYIAGTLGNDGDELDCTIGPSPLNAQAVYVVNQFIGGKFDEHKIMFGFASQAEAEAAYLGNYSHGWTGLESCVACSMDQLKRWISDGDKSWPITANEFSNEGMTMDKVLWDSANMPLHSNLEQVLYALRRDDAADGLLYDAVTKADILADADGVLAFDALVVQYARVEQRMAIMQKVLDRTGKAVKVAAMQVSEPFTQRGTTNVAVIYELTDGQTVSVFFHNPDVTPKKITAADELVSWKWMLNKKDITVAVAPEKGRDLEPRMVAARIMALAEKNSDRFIKANGKRAERMETIAGLQTELETKKATLAELEQQVAAAQAAADEAGNGDPEPVNPDPQPDPQPEPEPAPAPAVTLEVDSIRAVVTDVDPMAGVEHEPHWLMMNASRPLLGTETMSDGDYLEGRFYAAIDPADYMAAAYLSENKRQDARMVLIADEATQTIMALNTLNPKYLPAYMEMDEGERSSALRGFVAKLNGRTYGELKALAAKGMPVVDMWRRDVEAFAFNRDGFMGRAIELVNSDLLNQRPAGTWTITKMGEGTFAALFTNADGKTHTMAERSETIEQAHAAMLAHPDYIAATAPAVDPEAEARAAEEAADAAAAAEQAAREAEAEAAAKAAKDAQEAEEAADGDFLALAAVGDVDFYDKAVTDRLAALARKYTDPEGAYLDLVNQAKTAAKNWFVAEFKKRVG